MTKSHRIIGSDLLHSINQSNGVEKRVPDPGTDVLDAQIAFLRKLADAIAQQVLNRNQPLPTSDDNASA